MRGPQLRPVRTRQPSDKIRVGISVVVQRIHDGKSRSSSSFTTGALRGARHLYGPDDGAIIRAAGRGVRPISRCDAARRPRGGACCLISGSTSRRLEGPHRAGRPWDPGQPSAPIQVSYFGLYRAPWGGFHRLSAGDQVVLRSISRSITARIVHIRCYWVNDSKRKSRTRCPHDTRSGCPRMGSCFCCFKQLKLTRRCSVWVGRSKAASCGVADERPPACATCAAKPSPRRRSGASRI